MTSQTRAAHWLLIGSWLLMTPPTPLKTALPPLSEWAKVSTHKTSDECEKHREAMRSAARRTIGGDPNAPAVEVAAALGRLQSRCIEVSSKEPAEVPLADAPAAEAPPAANPPDAKGPAAAGK